MPCKHGFYVFHIGKTLNREASKVKLRKKKSIKADYKLFLLTKEQNKKNRIENKSLLQQPQGATVCWQSVKNGPLTDIFATLTSLLHKYFGNWLKAVGTGG